MNTRVYKLMTSASLALLITACGGGSSGGGGSAGADIEDKSVSFDASAGGSGASASDPANKYTYFDLNTGEVLELTDAEAESNTEWDIAFKRTKTKINGGASGPGSVTAALADAQDEFYQTDGTPINDIFLNATAASELAAFEAVTDASALGFMADANSPKIDGSLEGETSWALYSGPPDHTVDAQPSAWNMLKSADGSTFAKFHVTDIAKNADDSRSITVEFYIQSAGEDAFSDTPVQWVATFGAGSGLGSACYDLETAAGVDCDTASDSWDLMVEVAGGGFEWNMWTNGGIKGTGSDGGARSTAVADGEDFPYLGIGDGDDQLPERYLEADAPTGIFLENSWYAYSLEGNHKLWPNYRVFAIDIDGDSATTDDIYKLQFLSYYNEAGESGHLTLRVDTL